MSNLDLGVSLHRSFLHLKPSIQILHGFFRLHHLDSSIRTKHNISPKLYYLQKSFHVALKNYGDVVLIISSQVPEFADAQLPPPAPGDNPGRLTFAVEFNTYSRPDFIAAPDFLDQKGRFNVLEHKMPLLNRL